MSVSRSGHYSLGLVQQVIHQTRQDTHWNIINTYTITINVNTTAQYCNLPVHSDTTIGNEFFTYPARTVAHSSKNFLETFAFF
jgi:hypothetical protein